MVLHLLLIALITSSSIAAELETKNEIPNRRNDRTLFGRKWDLLPTRRCKVPFIKLLLLSE